MSIPVKIADNAAFVAIGNGHVLAVKTDGSLWAWGDNRHGQLGDGTVTKTKQITIPSDYMDDGFTTQEIVIEDHNKYAPVKIMDGAASVTARDEHGFVVRKDGSLWAWGTNSTGELGDGTASDRNKPVRIMDNVASVYAGCHVSYAIKTDASLWAWGDNEKGRLGSGTSGKWGDIVASPVKIMEDVTAVAAGDEHSLVLKRDGGLWAWGVNRNGQLGDGTVTCYDKDGKYADNNKCVPVKIMDDIVSITAGKFHSLAIKADGSLWAWGMNVWG